MSQSKNQAQLNESLSALVDDEASEFEVHRVLTESQQDASVRERWHRYQLAGAALRGEAVNLATNTHFADRIRDAIRDIEFDEPLASTADKSAREKQGSTASGAWKSGAGRFAIAASVAAAVFLGAQQMNLVAFNGEPGQSQEFAQQPADPAPTVAPSSVNIPTINVQNVSGGDTIPPRSRLPQSLQYSPNIQQQQLQDEQIRRYIRQLMLEHAEHSAQNSGSGLLPYARVPAEEER